MRINKRSRPFRAQCFQLGQSFRAFPIGAHVSSPYVLPQCPGYDTSACPTTLVCAAPLITTPPLRQIAVGVLCMNVTAGIGVLGQASLMIQEIFAGRVTPAAAAAAAAAAAGIDKKLSGRSQKLAAGLADVDRMF